MRESRAKRALMLCGACEVLERLRISKRLGVLDWAACSTSRTAISEILPERVRGISGTATMRAGTWRGEAPARI